MLKKENRLSTNFEFNITRKHGLKLSGDYCYLYYLEPKQKTGIARMGVVVSKKIHKSAVKRNRIKRLFNECLKQNFDKIPSGYWIVIQPKPTSLGSEYEKVCSDLDSLLQKISLA